MEHDHDDHEPDELPIRDEPVEPVQCEYLGMADGPEDYLDPDDRPDRAA